MWRRRRLPARAAGRPRRPPRARPAGRGALSTSGWSATCRASPRTCSRRCACSSLACWASSCCRRLTSPPPTAAPAPAPTRPSPPRSSSVSSPRRRTRRGAAGSSRASSSCIRRRCAAARSPPRSGSGRRRRWLAAACRATRTTGPAGRPRRLWQRTCSAAVAKRTGRSQRWRRRRRRTRRAWTRRARGPRAATAPAGLATATAAARRGLPEAGSLRRWASCQTQASASLGRAPAGCARP